MGTFQRGMGVKSMSVPVIERSKVGILLVDAQPSFWEQMDGPQEPVLMRIERLLVLAGWLELPLIATFEHPVEEKGTLPERLERVFPSHGKRLVKRKYNCCDDEPVRLAIKKSPVQQFVVAGSETDVCVLQSVLGLLLMNYQVFLLEDCVFTSEPHPTPALERMYQAGAVPCTVKTLIYELTRSVDYWSSPIKAGAIPQSFLEHLASPEKLPPWNFKR